MCDSLASFGNSLVLIQILNCRRYWFIVGFFLYSCTDLCPWIRNMAVMRWLPDVPLIEYLQYSWNDIPILDIWCTGHTFSWFKDCNWHFESNLCMLFNSAWRVANKLNSFPTDEMGKSNRMGNEDICFWVVSDVVSLSCLEGDEGTDRDGSGSSMVAEVGL